MGRGTDGDRRGGEKDIWRQTGWGEGQREIEEVGRGTEGDKGGGERDRGR